MHEHTPAPGPTAAGTWPGAELSVRRLAKCFRSGSQEVVAVDGVDLTVAAGSTVAITGPSGSGKSTLLHLIGAIERPDAGMITVDSVEVTGLTRRAVASYRRGVGLVFQRFHLLPTLSALDNVLAPLVPVRVDFDRRERALELLEAVGLGARATARPAELSGGQQQRVALARALVAHPRLLLADEPTGSLDSATGSAMVDLMLELQRRHGMTLLIATHEADVARRCGRVVGLRDGRVVNDQPTGPAFADC